MEDGWKYRRRLLFVTSAFYAGVIGYCVYQGKDTELARTAVTFAFLALSGNVGYYVFGSSWESIGMAKQGFIRSDSSFQTTEKEK